MAVPVAAWVAHFMLDGQGPTGDENSRKKLEKKGYLIIFEGFVPNLEYQKVS